MRGSRAISEVSPPTSMAPTPSEFSAPPTIAPTPQEYTVSTPTQGLERENGWEALGSRLDRVGRDANRSRKQEEKTVGRQASNSQERHHKPQRRTATERKNNSQEKQGIPRSKDPKQHGDSQTLSIPGEERKCEQPASPSGSKNERSRTRGATRDSQQGQIARGN